MSTPPDVFVSIILGVSALMGFATWMLVQTDMHRVPYWHGVFYILSAPLVVALHIIGAPVFAFATIRAAWDRHVRNHRARSETDSLSSSIWHPGDKGTWS